jgi:hypothetical protein
MRGFCHFLKRRIEQNVITSEMRHDKPRGENHMKDAPKTYGMLARDAAKDSQAFTHILLAEADSEGTARALIEDSAKNLRFLLDSSRAYIVMERNPRHSQKDPSAVVSELRTPMAIGVENQMAEEARKKKK